VERVRRTGLRHSKRLGKFSVAVEEIARVGGRSHLSIHKPRPHPSWRTSQAALFNKVQEQELLSELVKLEQSTAVAQVAGLSCLEERWADLLITLAQLRRILVNALYFLEVCDSLPSNQWIKPRNNKSHSH
jgi:hypothetical protein